MSGTEILALIGVVGVAITISILGTIRSEIRGVRGQVEILTDQVAELTEERNVDRSESRP